MKFFEAVELGWGLVTPTPYSAHGCALGMAHKAVGGNRKHALTLIGSNFQRWPWLRRQVKFICPVCRFNQPLYGIDMVAHLFDRHLFAPNLPEFADEKISRDQFIDYLRQLEEQATGEGSGAGEQVTVEAETPTESVLVTV